MQRIIEKLIHHYIILITYEKNKKFHVEQN